VANDPRCPFGLGVGAQQLTGRPAIGKGLFNDECNDCNFFDRRLEGKNKIKIYLRHKASRFMIYVHCNII